MLSAYDGSAITLTRKILDRPRLVARIRAAIGDTASAHMSCFNATEDEKLLALQLDIPLYACDPALSWLGGKSGSRAMFRAAGIDHRQRMDTLRGHDGRRLLNGVIGANRDWRALHQRCQLDVLIEVFDRRLGLARPKCIELRQIGGPVRWIA